MVTLASAEVDERDLEPGGVMPPSQGPWEFLALRIAVVLRLHNVAANVYKAPPSQIAVPAVVVTPGDPWMAENSAEEPFTRWREQYLLTALAPHADPASAILTLYQIVTALMDGIDTRGWWWIGVSGLTRVDSGGGQFLGVTMRVGHSVDQQLAEPKEG